MIQRQVEGGCECGEKNREIGGGIRKCESKRRRMATVERRTKGEEERGEAGGMTGWWRESQWRKRGDNRWKEAE